MRPRLAGLMSLWAARAARELQASAVGFGGSRTTFRLHNPDLDLCIHMACHCVQASVSKAPLATEPPVAVDEGP